MSQRAEKYSRDMGRRLDKLENVVGSISAQTTRNSVRISVLEDDLAVYRAAVSARDMKRAAEEVKAARRRREKERAERAEEVRKATLLCLAVVLLVMAALSLTVWNANACEAEQAEREQNAAPAVSFADAAAVLPVIMPEEPAEDPMEAEKIDAALLASGYLSAAVPMDYTLQDIMRTACAVYGCPYPLALGVAETESRFDTEAVGSAGEVGMMQLMPGPDGAYHKSLMAATGCDPTTPAGNITCGVYLLGKYLEDYGNTEKALMAYNMGPSRAEKAWAAGAASTEYTDTVQAAAERWAQTVNAWNGV